MIKEVLAEAIIEAIRKAIGPNSAQLHEPNFDGNEKRYLLDCIDSTLVSTNGKYVEKFESQIKELTNSRYAISTVNGTSALHLALIVAGVEPGDEVLVPALSFIATANAVSFCNAIPHFVEIEPRTLGIDVGKLRAYLEANSKIQSNLCVNKNTGKTIRAIVPMHVFGHPSEMHSLLELADDFHLAVVEDAAESIGSFYHGRHTGTLGDLGVISFNGNKTITSGGGGIILTNNKKFAEFSKHLSTTAKIPHKWKFEHDMVGFNYRMPNLNAALGCAQLEMLPSKLKLKRILFDKYHQEFINLPEVAMIKEPENSMSNYWLQGIVLDQKFKDYQDSIIEATNLAGYGTRPAWLTIDRQQCYTDCPRMELDIAHSLAARIINLPSSPTLIKQRDQNEAR